MIRALTGQSKYDCPVNALLDMLGGYSGLVNVR